MCIVKASGAVVLRYGALAWKRVVRVDGRAVIGNAAQLYVDSMLKQTRTGFGCSCKLSLVKLSLAGRAKVSSRILKPKEAHTRETQFTRVQGTAYTVRSNV